MRVDRTVRIAALALLAAAVLQGRSVSAADQEFFEKRIRPVLVEKCYQCHSALSAEVKGGLQVDSREALRQGGDSGPAVTPGDVSASLILTALKHEGLNMPPDEKLPAQVIADFEKWIESGAEDPRVAPASPASATSAARAELFDQLGRWWSLQPVRALSDAEFQTLRLETGLPGGSRIDVLLRQKLQAAGLKPAAEADRRTLIRRLSFALTGLPPAADDIEQFVSDDSPDAWERLVERVLSAPQFGERWARHWMDVVRYTDTYGYEWDMPAKGAWRYRDYLVRALNDDVPFDQLVREQIAGDLLEQPRLNAIDQVNESLIGTMFFQMGEKRHGDSSEFDGIHQEMLDNKIDAFSKAFQALTISCARCHDHKIDPVLQSEYYALAGVFMSSRWVSNTVDLPTRQHELRRELQDIKQQLRPLLAARWSRDLEAWEKNSDRPGLQPAADQPAELPLEDLRHPWVKLSKAAADGSLAETWDALTKQYQTESLSRAAENAGHFTLIADFRQGVPEGWSVDGVGLEQMTPCGDFTVALEGDAAVGQISHGGLVTNSLSSRLNGALRTPWLNTLEPGHLSFEQSGGDFSARRSVIDNAFLTEKQAYLANRLPEWVLMGTFPEMRERHIYLEFATKSSNPNFPPRVGLGGPCSEEQVADPRSWFAVSRVVRHMAPSTPKDELTRFAKLFEGPPPASLEDVAARYRDWFESAVTAWGDSRATDDDVRLLNWLLDAKLLSNQTNSEDAATLRDLVSRYRTLERELQEPWTVNGMADLDPGFNVHLFERGEYDQPRDAIPRGYLQTLAREGAAFASPRSGRRELAERIASPHNPLTARVFVNRVWQWLFGTGLVATSNDFGHLGELPSHPELLDDLTARFVAEGWSIKRLVREIVRTEAWRQSSELSEQGRALDPANRLLHHFPLRRLEAEEIRDAMLFASGRLDDSLYGPTINPHRMNEDDQKRLFSGPIDGNGRRSIYTKLTIMEPPRFLALFNQPPPKIPTGTRDVTTTPAQSLALLNDPFVAQQAEVWAHELIHRNETSTYTRIEEMFETALGRPPSAEELARWGQAVRDLAVEYQVTESELLGNPAVWKETAHALLNTKEMIYVK